MPRGLIALLLGTAMGLGMGFVAWGRPNSGDLPVSGTPHRTPGRAGDLAPVLEGRRDQEPRPDGPSSPQPATSVEADPQIQTAPASLPSLEVKYEGPPLSYESAVALVRSEVTESDLKSLLERQYLPGLADLRPPLSDRQREEILSHLRSASKEYLLAERVELGLRGKLTEDARANAIKLQSRANRESMRFIRERVLTREQESQLPSYWRDL